ncbi:MAG: response regulator [Nitrospinae bacterium]|nr:response regulator [Nitrospinota bacterium]
MSDAPSQKPLALVVDDYHSMRVTLRELLEELGFAVEEAENGLEGLEKAKGKKYNLIFTDIVMPVMDGLELCNEIKTHPTLNKIPVVVLSTHTDATYLVKAISMGADDYVPKPIERALLQKVVTRLTDGY